MILLCLKEKAIEHLKSLSPEDRYTRFCSTANDEYIEKYVNTAKGFFYGLFDVVPNRGGFTECAALLHLVYDAKTNSIEVAVSVMQKHRGKGFSKKLMYFAMGMAEVYQAKSLIVSGLSNNSPMVNLAKECGYIVNHDYGEFEGVAETIGADFNRIVENNIKLFTLWKYSYQ